MKKQFAILGLSAILLAAACNDTTEEQQENNSSETSTQPIDNALAMLNSNCFSCHNPEKEAAVRVAPTMADIRQAYMTEGMSQQEFIDKVSNFINHPEEKNSMMPNAVSKYGMMPKLSYKAEDLQKMAAYIYDTDMSTDEWYAQWKNNKDQPTTTNTSDMSYEDLGLSIANGTKAQLGKNLMGAIKQHGAPGAVTFCNTRAIPLTDSMAKVFNAIVKRVSDMPRNPDNTADEEAMQYIARMKEQIKNGEEPQPIVAEHEGKMVGYYAIVTNKMCMQCHGDKDKDILPETYANIKKAYPSDKATGYSENQLRGVWVITMDKK